MRLTIATWMRWPERLVRRRRVAKLSREKQELNIWSIRWLTACNRFWKRFEAMPVCEHSLRWAERNNRRLCDVSARKRIGGKPPNDKGQRPGDTTMKPTTNDAREPGSLKRIVMRRTVEWVRGCRAMTPAKWYKPVERCQHAALKGSAFCKKHQPSPHNDKVSDPATPQ